MVRKGVLVRLEALPGNEDELTSFLEGARAIVMEEPGTVAWFAVRMGPSTFGVFDVFPDDEARDAHLAGGVGQELRPNTGVLFSPRHRSRRSTSSPTNFRGSPCFAGGSALWMSADRGRSVVAPCRRRSLSG